jgi:hypothetical protein
VKKFFDYSNAKPFGPTIRFKREGGFKKLRDFYPAEFQSELTQKYWLENDSLTIEAELYAEAHMLGAWSAWNELGVLVHRDLELGRATKEQKEILYFYENLNLICKTINADILKIPNCFLFNG